MPEPRPSIRIGTRASRLAQAQTRMMQARLAAALGGAGDPDAVAPLLLITTTGDRIQDRRLLEVGGKALFTKELDAALLAGEVDLAVHSLKDVPAEIPPGTTLAFPERADARDALVTRDSVELDGLPKGARIGTASLRRGAQLRFRRPDLRIELLRGNVDTRLGRLDAGEFDAIVLAAAGLDRLGLGERAPVRLDPWAFPPAPGQGVLALQARAGAFAAEVASRLEHAPTRVAVEAERAALHVMEGSCRTAMGAYAVITPGRVRMVVEALSPDGTLRVRREGEAETGADDTQARVAAEALGRRLAEAVRDEGGARLELA